MRSYNKFVYRIKNSYNTKGGIKKNPTHEQLPTFVLYVAGQGRFVKKTVLQKELT